MTTTTNPAPKSTRLPRVTTELFEFSHMRKPRGTGGWAFRTKEQGWTHPANEFHTRGTYAEAKKAAQLHYRGHGQIEVLP